MEGALRSSRRERRGALLRTLPVLRRTSRPRCLPRIENVYYTYVLESIKRPGTRYIGQTEDLRRRLVQHNAGENRSTARNRPWKLKLYVAFETRCSSRDFERYLKSGSGHAFANRHFWNGKS